MGVQNLLRQTGVGHADDMACPAELVLHYGGCDTGHICSLSLGFFAETFDGIVPKLLGVCCMWSMFLIHTAGRTDYSFIDQEFCLGSKVSVIKYSTIVLSLA